MGEGFGPYTIADDRAIMPYVDACNIACGFHAGDPLVIEQTITLALAYDKEIGAHPSYPDRQGFGRRSMQIQPDELVSILCYQIGAVKALSESLGGVLNHVKVHGALYNDASINPHLAEAVVKAVLRINPALIIYAPFHSVLQQKANEAGLSVSFEAFADRVYTSTGALKSRLLEGSCITDPEKALAQVKQIKTGTLDLMNGHSLNIRASTFCVHSDTPGALAILQKLREYDI